MPNQANQAKPRRKLSATGLSTFLTSPKSFYWRYIANLEPAVQSINSFDHDKLCGVLWAEFVDRYYKKAAEASNTKKLLADWDEQTAGWVPDKIKEKLTTALTSWAAEYYQKYSPDDGIRNGSEKFVENERFLGYLDGLSHDLVVHEVKSTSRAKSVAEQMWKVSNSIQIKLYCVLAKAIGYRIEFAWKDAPYGIFRGPVVDVSAEQRKGWEQELNTLADFIHSLGDDPHNYPCNPAGCCIVTKGFVGMCANQSLCDMGLNEFTKIAFKQKLSREEKLGLEPNK